MIAINQGPRPHAEFIWPSWLLKKKSESYNRGYLLWILCNVEKIVFLYFQLILNRKYTFLGLAAFSQMIKVIILIHVSSYRS